MFELDQRRFNRLAIVAVVVGFVLLAIGFAGALYSQAASARGDALVQHTFRVRDSLSRLEIIVERSETAARGYVVRPDPLRRQTFAENRDLIEPLFNDIRRLTRDNEDQAPFLRMLGPLLATERASLEKMLRLADQRGVDAARAYFVDDVAKGRVRDIRSVLASMSELEEALLQKRLANQKAASRAAQVALIVTGLLLALLGGITFATVRRYTGQLEEARQGLNAANAGLEARVKERTSDLQRVNAELQRFAYIVSHDLRSPLVNIMGFTAELDTAAKSITNLLAKVEEKAPELIDNDARLAATEDLPESVGFIRASTQKMDRLINAILRLSREGRRNLRPERLDMDNVVEGIAATFEQQLSGLDARLIVAHPLPPIESDRVVIEQVISNLVDNALKYGVERGGEIRIAGARRDEMIEYTVSDDGRGIDPKDHERIFDLFRRAGKQDVAGEGLGLAHVRALAYRLGGSIDVASALGEGATFRLILPMTYREQEPEA